MEKNIRSREECGLRESSLVHGCKAGAGGDLRCCLDGRWESVILVGGI